MNRVMKVEEETTESSFEQTLEGLVQEIRGRGPRHALRFLVLINLGILFVRPQYNLPLIGYTYLPLLLSLCVLPFVLPRLQNLWQGPVQIKGLFLFLALGAAWVPLAHNNSYAFHTLRDVAAQLLCYLFPILLFFRTGRELRSVFLVITGIGLYLGIYSATHNGTGPGAFLGDENDLCLALLAALGLSLFLFNAAYTNKERLLHLIASLSMFGGVVFTMSRGGFLGLVALLGFVVLRAYAKLTMVLIALIVGIVGLFYVPDDYWEEMSTIHQVQEGTAYERMRMWKVALNIWLDPPHILFGTGMNNAPAWMSEYEPEINKSHYGRSLAGRAVHSTLFQLLADLGLAGLILISTIWGACYLGNRRSVRLLSSSARTLSGIDAGIREYEGQLQIVHDVLREEVRAPEFLGAEEEVETKTVRGVIHQAQKHCRYLIAASLGLNASIIGVIVAALFVSTLYYPPIWLLVICSTAVHLHAVRLSRRIEELTARIRFTAQR